MRNIMVKKKPTVCVVIPAYEVAVQIRYVLSSIGKEVDQIIVVDDKCPGKSGEIAAKVKDRRIEVIFHDKNYGVGAAMRTGYARALELGADVIVKVDGDGQMDTRHIKDLIEPILQGSADYTKGNRFFEVEAVKQMPKLRIFGNLFLSFLTKLSTGYWHIFDPNNGFTAISRTALARVPLQKIDSRYFFESDMLFRLYLSGCVTKDVSIPAIYGDEVSNLKIRRVLFEFPVKHFRNLIKRIFYSYYLKQFNLASIELPLGIGFAIAGLVRGSTALSLSNQTGQPTPAGTVVLTAILLLAGLQFILAFLNFDMTNEPRK
jgi:glycosyltransferase involved in cell wall biosynthesis